MTLHSKRNKNLGFAAGAGNAIGRLGTNLVILVTILATSSAIIGTVFGSSRQIAVIAQDGYLPKLLAKRKKIFPSMPLLRCP